MKYFLLLLCAQISLQAGESSGNCNRRTYYHSTETPIKHVVVIYAENRSFDHFFGTYPTALNPPGEPHFKARSHTPNVNGLSQSLIAHNNNFIPPFRLSRTEDATCSPVHAYNPLQVYAHAGLLDQFHKFNGNCPDVMGYYDGNTVTAIWNYAQEYSMSDNFHSTTMTPSTPGHLNLISGQTHGTTVAEQTDEEGFIVIIDHTLIADLDPQYDRCSEGITAALTGRNLADLLNAKNISWGWFQGGFRDCNQSHIGSNGLPTFDYIPHHEPFNYYAHTSNSEHLPPSSPHKIGLGDQANHQYDLEDFWTAVDLHNVPAVSFLKPAAYQDCHPGYSSPLAFQTFLVQTINRLQKTPEWRHMAIIIAWDDSGGFYDHEMPPIINQSQTEVDALAGPGNAGNNPPLGGYQARLAYGTRVPFLIVSPFAKSNFVDHRLIDQTSILRFIEDNWRLGQIGDFSFDEFAGSLLEFFDFSNPRYKPFVLDPGTGLVVKKKINRLPRKFIR